jgi:hypothetical protein
MRYINKNILSAADTSSQNGSKVDANQLVSASFAFRFGDAGANGTCKIQASNDPCAFGNLAADFTVTNWVDVPNASAAITSGASALITIANMSYRWIRAVYTRSSGGSTTVNCDMNALSA